VITITKLSHIYIAGKTDRFQIGLAMNDKNEALSITHKKKIKKTHIYT
jgi:hypothetical protein